MRCAWASVCVRVAPASSPSLTTSKPSSVRTITVSGSAVSIAVPSGNSCSPMTVSAPSRERGSGPASVRTASPASGTGASGAGSPVVGCGPVPPSGVRGSPSGGFQSRQTRPLRSMIVTVWPRGVRRVVVEIDSSSPSCTARRWAAGVPPVIPVRRSTRAPRSSTTPSPRSDASSSTREVVRMISPVPSIVRPTMRRAAPAVSAMRTARPPRRTMFPASPATGSHVRGSVTPS